MVVESDGLSPRRILVTGAGGALGQIAMRALSERFQLGEIDALRGLDIRSFDAPAGVDRMIGDLADAQVAASAVESMEAVVHLAGQATETDWPSLLSPNIVAVVALWEAAACAGVGKIVFSSSSHVTGHYATGTPVGPETPPCPDSRYAVTKVFGEQLAHLYALKTGVSAFCLRIASCLPRPTTRRHLATWLSPDDFVQLVLIGLNAPDRFRIAYGVSGNCRSDWDVSNLTALGYRPMDCADDHGPNGPDDMTYQGGSYAHEPL